MEKNIFLDLARTVAGREERKRMLNFVRSPYFNLSEKIDLQVVILELAWKWWDSNNDDYWSETKVFTQIFGKQEAFSQIKIDRLKSSVTGLLRDFFAEETRCKRQHPVEKLCWEMRYYRAKGLFHLHGLREKEARQKMEARKNLLSPAELLHEYLLNEEVAWLSPGETRDDYEVRVARAIKSLDTFWLASRAHWCCVALNQQQRATVDGDIYQWFPLRILHKFSDYEPTKNVLVRLYQQVPKLFEPTEEPETVLNGFLAQVRELCAETDPSIQDEMEALAGNFCVRQINNGRTEFYQHHFDILKSRLDSKRIYHEGKILASSYLAIATTGLKLPREVVPFEWIEEFLNSHKTRIYNHEAAEEMVRYNFANYYFHTGDYARALKNMKETYKDLNFKMVAKVLEIKILFEIGNEKTPERIRANHKFFERDPKIPDPKRKPLMHFASCAEKIFLESALPRVARLEALRKKVLEQPTAERIWLLEKIQQLFTRATPTKRKT